MIIIYILSNNIFNYQNSDAKAQEIYYANSLDGSSTLNSNSSSSSLAINNSTDTEEIIDNLKDNLTTDDKNNPDIISTLGEYVEIIDSCDAGYGGTCVRARSCPSTSCPVVLSLRNNIVLATDNQQTEADDINWTHIIFNE